ncbi:alpha/beta hydrolase [Peteryoungia desertarenae]|uniref:Alpha/beta hydrolase n=1 Tax=Peteryoungia desertarenae TaxID=1813451 RepID=A0ABX6QMM1_9HYPH|nr:alpha/beta hydrolase [Peteryoungia desertarenae]QLF69717.1 alpha/beta hydrolase [Peteryoungia desertarenae]
MSLDAYHHLYQAPEPGEPLVFAFHGTGGDEHQFPGLVKQILPLAGFVSPRGDVSEHGANRFFRRTGEGIYDMADLAARRRAMAGFIRAHKDRHPATPIYGIGYSNGANILASVLFEEPDLIDRAVLMHPLIPWTPEPQPGLASVSLLVTAGARDPICPPALTKALIDYLEAQGGDVQSVTHSGGHEIQKVEIEAIADFLRR